MSYYSDVGLVISKDDYDRMCKAVGNDGMNQLQRAVVEDFTRRVDQSRWVMIQWSEERWYIGYDVGIDAIEAFIETIPHEYLRSGEELVDVKHENTTDYADVLGVAKKLIFYP